MDTLSPHAGIGNPYTVYALLDPRDSSIKYVGMSVDPERRLAEHIGQRASVRPEKRAWLDELAVLQLVPVLLPLETDILSEQIARNRENFWIREILEAGYELLNSPSTNGGRLRSNAHVQEILKFYQEFGSFPEGVSPQMQRYYKREYPKFFRRRRRA